MKRPIPKVPYLVYVFQRNLHEVRKLLFCVTT